MEFLVQFKWTVPAGMPDEQWQAIRAAERAHGGEMMDAGKMLRIWRLPGQRSVIALYDVADTSELDRLLMSLPMNPYFEVQIQPLAAHPLEQARVDIKPDVPDQS